MELHIKSKVVSVHGKMDVLDENDDVVYRVSSKALSLHDKTRIEDADGNPVAAIHAKAVSIHHVYYVEMAQGPRFELKERLGHIKDIVDIDDLGWRLQGDILAFNFQIVDETGLIVATAHRKVVSLHGVYTLDIADESQADIVVALFVIMKHIIEQRNEATMSSIDFNG